MAKEDILITVIICTYQKFGCIYETIRSVLEQTYGNIECIITDDASEDFPRDAIAEYIETHRKQNLVRYHIITHEKNVGTVRNLNGAYKMAKGDYIVHLSGDDVFFGKNVLLKLAKRIKKRNPGLMVTSAMAVDEFLRPVCFFPHRRAVPKIKKCDTNKKQYEALVSRYDYSMASGSVFCINREVLEEIGYLDEKYRLWEDTPFGAEYSWKRKIELAYDIISIRYALDGVSNGRKVNPTLKKDAELFAVTDARKHYAELSKLCRDAMDMELLCRTRTAGSFFIAFIKYPSAFARRVFYHIDLRVGKMMDSFIIKRSLRRTEICR